TGPGRRALLGHRQHGARCAPGAGLHRHRGGGLVRGVRRRRRSPGAGRVPGLHPARSGDGDPGRRAAGGHRLAQRPVRRSAGLARNAGRHPDRAGRPGRAGVGAALAALVLRRLSTPPDADRGSQGLRL
ncbi:MAG: hypothetical protein AVDCRST_MAG51-382, partial [uncultured Ramlibacter sp.]